MGQRPTISTYTCGEYRLEMMLLGLETQLGDPDIPQDQKKILEEEARRLRQQLGMD